MKHRLLPAIACFAIAFGACRGDRPPPRVDGGMDMRSIDAIDAKVPADAAPSLVCAGGAGCIDSTAAAAGATGGRMATVSCWPALAWIRSSWTVPPPGLSMDT